MACDREGKSFGLTVRAAHLAIAASCNTKGTTSLFVFAVNENVNENPWLFVGPASWASLMPRVQWFLVERARPSGALIQKYLSTTIPHGEFDQNNGRKPHEVFAVGGP